MMRPSRYHGPRKRPGLPQCVSFLCAVVLTLMLIASIILFVLCLRIRPHRPKFFLADFSIPDPGSQSGYRSRSGLANLPVSFTVAEHNPNQKIGIYYGEVVASVYYRDQLVVKGTVAQPFYQAPKGDTRLQGQLAAADTVWAVLFAGDLDTGTVRMRLVLTSTVQFPVKMLDTKHHHMKVECDFRMGGDGTLQQQDKNSQCTLYF